MDIDWVEHSLPQAKLPQDESEQYGQGTSRVIWKLLSSALK